jgi:hypothetical protein
LGTVRSGWNISIVIASKAKRSRHGDCGCGFVWIASLPLAMTVRAAST